MDLVNTIANLSLCSKNKQSQIYSLMKRIFLYIFSILFIVLLNSCSGDKEFSKTENIQVIPKNAAIIIEGRDLRKTYEVIQEVEFSKLFTESNEFNTLFQSINNLNNTLKNNGASVWMDKGYSLSLHTTGSTDFGHLFIIDDIRQDALKSIKKAFDDSKFRKETYENQTIYHLSSPELSFVQIEQFFILSNEDILVKDAIRQHAAKTDLPSDEHFQNAFKSADRSELLNIYIQTKELMALFGMTYNTSKSFLHSINEWLALDVNIDNDRILMSGICTAKDNNRLHKLMFGTNGKKTDVFEYLPSNTNFFLSKLFPSFDQYMSSRLKTLEHEQRLEDWKKYKKNSPFNVEDFLKTLGDEYTYAMCGSEIESKNAIGVIKLADVDDAKRFLKVSDLPNYRSFEFRKLPNAEILNFILGDFFKPFLDPKCIIIDDYAIFANSLSNLKSIINDYKSENTLDHQDAFNNLKDELSSRSNVLMYISEDALEKYPAQMARKKNIDQQKEVGKGLLNLGKVFAQVKIEDDYFQINLVSKNPKKKWKAPNMKSDWSIELENGFSSKPVKLWNHVDKTYEIAIQDHGHILYLISDLGKVIWKKQLTGKIIGDIKQIDIYKNNRYQMLVQTKTEILLLDRNGELVDGYPIALPSPSSAEMAVFDYENNKTFRLLVPCEQHLAMYDQKGNLVTGWKAYNQDISVIRQPRHDLYDGKDYISVLNEQNEILMLKRNGELRVKKAIPQTPHHQSNLFRVNHENGFHLGIIAESNDEFYISNEGELNSKPGIKGNILSMSCTAQNKTFVLKDEIISQTTDDEFSYDFDIDNSEVFLNRDKKNNMTCLVDNNKEKVYVFDAELKPLKDFPIYGSTSALLTDMNNKTYVKLFVGGSDGTLYSYQISK